MRRATIAVLCAGPCLAAITLTTAPAQAQAAAESAAILSGSAQTGAAQRSLGGSIARSINGASRAISAQRGAAQGSAPNRAAPRGVTVGHSLPAGVDPLQGTDAATYTVGSSGASIRTSGRINTAGGTVCTKNCPAPSQPAP